MKHLFYLLVILSFSVFAETTPKISFTENKGQICDQNYKSRTDVLFSGTDGQLTFHIKNNGISYQLYRVDKWKEEEFGKIKEKVKIPEQTTIYRIDANWLNTNLNCVKETENASPGYNNYYLEQCPNGALNVKSYKGITLKNIYTNINLHYYEKDGVLKYDYIVAPHANYKQIQIEINGAEIKLQKDGSLLLKTPLGDVQEGKPVAFQNGKQLQTSWKVKNNILSFEIQNYNSDSELVIDPPTRIWGTYYGGTTYDTGNFCKTDTAGNVFVAGYTQSNIGTTIATTGSHQSSHGGSVYDAYLAKFDPTGMRLWGTYYGGAGIDYGLSCCPDISGNVFLSGYTTSTLSIASIGSHQSINGGGTTDAFLVKFNMSGVRQWGTYYGGAGDDHGFPCITDSLGNVYIGGYTTSNTGTVIASAGSYQSTYGGGPYDAYLVKFDGTGIRQWGTYYGGLGEDYGYSCAIDKAGNIFLAGRTSSTLSAVMSTPGSHQNIFGGGFTDAFLVKFKTTGVRQWGTFYGGNGNDHGYSCATDTLGNVFLSGNTDTNGGTAIASFGSHQSAFGGGSVDAFLAKFDSVGVRKWGTYYGGVGGEGGSSCTINSVGDVFLAGGTDSNVGTTIATSGSYQSSLNNATDGYFVKFSTNGVRHWGSYYGGVGSEGCTSLACDRNDNFFITGNTNTNPGTIIASSGSHQSIYGGLIDAFLVKFNDCPYPAQPSAILGNTIICSGSTNTYSISTVSGATSYSWSLPSGWIGASNSNMITTSCNSSGGNISVSALNSCGSSFITILTLSVNSIPTVAASSSSFVCSGSMGCLSAMGAMTYTWVGPCAFISTQANPCFPFNYFCNCSFSVTGTDANGCQNSATVCLNVYPNPTVTAVTSNSIICGPPFPGTASLTASGATSYSWSTSSTSSVIAVSPSITTNYSVTGTDANGCQNTAMITQSVSTCTGINESYGTTQIVVFPNPTKGTLKVVVPENFVETSIEIYNAIGERIYKAEIQSKRIDIDLSKEASGIYFVKTGNTVTKVIKE